MVGIDEGRDKEVAVPNASLIGLARGTIRPLGWLDQGTEQEATRLIN